MIRRPPRSPLFPYAPLFRSGNADRRDRPPPPYTGDGRPDALKKAHRLDRAIDAEATGGFGVDSSIEAVGLLESIGTAIACVRGGGAISSVGVSRSEERRVGEEGRSRGAPDHLKKKV